MSPARLVSRKQNERTIEYDKNKLSYAFVWLDRMLHHRADPTNAMIGGENSQTTSPM